MQSLLSNRVWCVWYVAVWCVLVSMRGRGGGGSLVVSDGEAGLSSKGLLSLTDSVPPAALRDKFAQLVAPAYREPRAGGVDEDE